LTHRLGRYARNQNGFTLIEVVIASAIGAILMAGLTSVMLTSWRASTIATNRIEASGQIRNFEFFAYDDFARSRVPIPSVCGIAPNSPCTTQPIVLNGWQVTNPAASPALSYVATYTWDGVQFVDRQVSGSSLHAATGVTAFSWRVDASTQHPTVVINMTITVGSYQESQTLRFLPQVMG
jgi:prepilin-type N-terminal cleavage/methylation domain-containing protein